MVLVGDGNGAWFDCVIEKREMGDENGGDEEGGVLGVSGGSSSERREGAERRFK